MFLLNIFISAVFRGFLHFSVFQKRAQSVDTQAFVRIFGFYASFFVLYPLGGFSQDFEKIAEKPNNPRIGGLIINIATQCYKMEVLTIEQFLVQEKLNIQPVTADRLKNLDVTERSLKRKLASSKLEPTQFHESQNGKYRHCIRLYLTEEELDAFNNIMYEVKKNALTDTLTYQKLQDTIPFIKGLNELNSVTITAIYFQFGVWYDFLKNCNPLKTILLIDIV